MVIFVAAVSTALIVSFLCSIFESVLLSLSPARVEGLVSDGKRSGELLRDFKANIDVPIAAILIVNTIAHTIGATIAGASYVEVFSGNPRSCASRIGSPNPSILLPCKSTSLTA